MAQPAMQMMGRRALTVAEIKECAPSVFGKAKAAKMSEAYTFVPTFKVIEALDKLGLVPTSATQRSSKDGGDVARHMVRFAFKQDLGKAKSKNDLIEEVVWQNAHNGRSAAKMMYGMFRVVCANGLIVSDASVGMSKRHIGSVDAILAEVDETLKKGVTVIKQVKEMRACSLTATQRQIFAQKALELRYLEEHRGQKSTMKTTITADQLLIPRRPEDKKDDLWHVFNVIQENLVQGGLEGKSALGRTTHTRQLHDVRKLVSVNTGLWDLAQGILKPVAKAPKQEAIAA